jgi:hypothetical protein
MPTLDEKPATAAKSAKNRKSLAPRLPATAAGKLATTTGKKAAATGNSQMGIEAQSFYKSPVKKSIKSEKVGCIFYIFFYFNSLFQSVNTVPTCTFVVTGYYCQQSVLYSSF